MNKKELLIHRSKVRNQYAIRGGSYYSRRAVNAIYFSAANSWIHELKKAQVCYKLISEGKKFITEALHRKTKLIRDIVVLDTHEVIEIETTKKRAARFKDQDVTVIMV